jgi:hypothetical protein
MLIQQMLKQSKILFIGMFCNILITSICLASGSLNGSYSGFQEADYDVGKKVFYEKVVCEACPYHDLSLVAEEIISVIPDLQRSGDIGQFLSLHQRKSVQLFINKRFNI